MSFPRYPKYKESGVEWLGEVPEHWGLKRLKYLCRIQTGDKDTVHAVEDGTYPFFVRSQTIERINSFTFDCEAVLTAGDGVGVGKVFHYHQGPFDFHQRVYMLNGFQGASGRYLFHFLKENFYKVALEGGAKSTVDSLRRPLFTNFTIAVPPPDEQAAIVEIVDRESAKIDELVAEQRRLIELLKEKRQAVISHAVTKGLNPHAPMKPSGIDWIGDVPEHWELFALKRDLDFLTSGSRGWAENYSDGGELFLRIGNLTRDNIGLDLSDIQRVEVPAGSEASRTKVRGGDVIFSVTAYLGSVAVVPDDLESAYVSQHVALARLARKRLAPRWVGYAAISVIGKTWFDTQAYGGTKIQLSLDDVRNLVLTVPPVAEQEAIVGYLDRAIVEFDTLTAEADQAIDLLQERRTALISAAVTGKIDVRGLAATEAR